MNFLGLKKILSQFMAPGRSVAPVPTPGPERLMEVNVLAIKNTILFPGGVLPLHIFEDRYKAMTEDALRKQIPMAMTPISDSHEIQLGLVCGGGKVTVVQEYPDKRKNILIEGECRFRIREIVQEQPFFKVMAEKVEDISFSDSTSEALSRERLENNVKKWIFANPGLDDALINYIFIFEKPHQLADFVASHFLPTMNFKQKMLEEADCAKRVAAINAFLEEEIENYSRMIQTNPHVFMSIPRSQMH